MHFDDNCPARTDKLQIPTLQAGAPTDSCERLDYRPSQDLALTVHSNAALSIEADRLFRQAKEAATTMRPEQEQDIRQASRKQAEKAYDLNQYWFTSPGVFRLDQSAPNDSFTPRGSAFTVEKTSNECLFVTDYHVVANETTPPTARHGLSLQNADGNRFHTQVRNWNPKTDLALLTTPANEMTGCPVLPLAESSKDLHPGEDRLVAVGHPLGSSLQFLSAGRLNEMGRTHIEINPRDSDKLWGENKTIEVQAKTIGGLSGSPSAANRRVVGIVEAGSDNLMVLHPVEDIHDLLNSSLHDPSKEDKACDYDQAKEELKQMEAANQVATISSSKTFEYTGSDYTFKNGKQLNFDEIAKTCNRGL